MEKQTIPNLYLKLISVIAWFALAAQFGLMLQNGKVSNIELTVRFFSYFTILTNTLVAVCCTFLGWFRDSNLGKRFSSDSIQTAVAVYITVVGLIYNTVLRFIWSPTGLQRLVDELLHLFIPILFVLHWWFSVRRKLPWRAFWAWLVYPLVYLSAVMVRGRFSGFYPYPFIDLTRLEVFDVAVNCIGITLIFVVVSLIFIAIGSRKPESAAIHRP